MDIHSIAMAPGSETNYYTPTLSDSVTGLGLASGLTAHVSLAGFVRRTSSRLIPDLNGKHMTIGRPIDLDEEEYEEYMRSLNNGKRQ